MANLMFLSGFAYRDTAGNPYASAKLYAYLTGTTTAQDTFTSASLAVANANPIVADSSTGIFPDIYLPAKRFKFVLKDSSDNTLDTWDPVDANSQIITSASAPSPTFPLLYWYDTTTAKLKRRSSADSSWLDLGGIDSLINAATVTEQLTGTETAKSSTPDSVAALWQRGTNITPSGGTVSLPSTGGGVFNIAAGNFSAISSAQGGRRVTLVFGGASVITYNATSMILLSGASETTYAGLVKEFVNEAAADASGGSWRETSRGGVATQAQMEAGSATEAGVTPARQHFHPGHPKWWGFVTVAAGVPTLAASYNLTSITDTGTGILTATIANDLSSTSWAPFVTIQRTNTGTGDTDNFTCGVRSATIAAGSVAFDCLDQQASQVAADPTSWSIFGLGDI